MKNIFSILTVSVLLFYCQAGFAQKSPAPVFSTKYTDAEITKMIEKYEVADSRDVSPGVILVQQFNTDFPKAYDIEWETATGIYEVEFKLDKMEYKAYYDAKGNLLMCSYKMPRQEIPFDVRYAAQKKKYPGYKLDAMGEKIMTSSNTLYKMKLTRKGTEIYATFDSSGNFMSERYDD